MTNDGGPNCLESRCDQQVYFIAIRHSSQLRNAIADALKQLKFN